MATAELKTVNARLVLENGTDSDGNLKLVKQSIQDVSEEGYTDSKFMSIVAAMGPVLSKTISYAQKVMTYDITNN